MNHGHRRLGILLAAAAATLAGCASVPADPARPDAWERASLARLERRLERSPSHIRDPALQGYLEQLAGLLGLDPGDAEPLRIFVMDRSDPQADLLGARILRLNLGLLLALDNEAELAFVLAHELAHRDLRHDEDRRRAGWNPLDAEVQADAAATSALVRHGYPAATGLTLLTRLQRTSATFEGRAQLAGRVAALAASGNAAGTAFHADQGRFERHIAPYRARRDD